MDFKKIIKREAANLGIDLCGITNNKKLDHRKDYLALRRERKYDVEFEHDDIERRINPLLTMVDCKSIIVLGISYGVKASQEPEYLLKGRISRSSWGKDYHEVLGEKILKLINKLKVYKDFNYKFFVDTGPLLERELAYKAGIGYFGKNCSIINKEYGSFIFLGYIMVDFEIEEDKSETNQCGACNLCLQACPTGALEQPFKINSRKCISYLTQTRQTINQDLIDKMGINIYGCDVCQLVCPKNKAAKLSDNQEFIPSITKGYLDLEEILSISNKEFKEKYGHMAGSWRGKNILKRNAIIALGNMKDKKNLGLLEKELKNESQMIQYYARWAIENIYKNN